MRDKKRETFSAVYGAHCPLEAAKERLNGSPHWPTWLSSKLAGKFCLARNLSCFQPLVQVLCHEQWVRVI